jgi:hypothetical protein
MATDIHYTLRDKNISPIELSKWVKARMPKFATNETLIIARMMIKGERWNPPIYEVNEWRDNGPCDYVITPDPANMWEVRDAEYAAHHKLGAAGAAGNSSAAIDFCQLYMAGKLNYLGVAIA